MKILLLILAISGFTPLSFEAHAEIGMLYSEKGYPYRDLIARTDEIKIFYTEKDATVRCRVEVAFHGVTWKPAGKQVAQRAFDEAPLSSCLSRDKARQILATTFN